MFCWTVSREPCTSFVLAMFRLTRTIVCKQLLFMAFHCEGAELSEVIPPLFVLEAASQWGWQPNKFPHNFLHGQEGRGGDLIPLSLAPTPSEPQIRASQNQLQVLVGHRKLVVPTSSYSTWSACRTKLRAAHKQKWSTKRKGTEERTLANLATSETP